MAEQKFVKYGDRVMEIPAGMTQEQAKGQMARFFPELADPAIETKKADGRVTWVFTKKAGKKGARRNAGRIKRLLAVPAEDALPPDLLEAVRGGAAERLPLYLGGIAAGLRDEAAHVQAARHALLDLVPAQRQAGPLL